MRYQGKIDSWKDDKGFGFISQQPDGNKVFVHISSFLNRQRRPVGKEIVSYELKADGKGRHQAVKVAFANERIPIMSPDSRSKAPLTFAGAFIFFIACAALIGRLPLIVFGIYLVVSAITFIVYALDKSAAKAGKWRTQESTLHLCAVIGGWPGALAAQRLLRHKSKKITFRIVFWITVVLNCSALGFLFTASGKDLFRSVMSRISG